MTELLLRERERIKIESDTLRHLHLYDISQVYDYFAKMYKKIFQILTSDMKVYDKYTSQKLDFTFVKEIIHSSYHVNHSMNNDPLMFNEHSKTQIDFKVIDPYEVHLHIFDLMKS